MFTCDRLTQCVWPHSWFTLLIVRHPYMYTWPHARITMSELPTCHMFSFLYLCIFMWFHLVLPVRATVLHLGGRKQSVSGESPLWKCVYIYICVYTASAYENIHAEFLKTGKLCKGNSRESFWLQPCRSDYCPAQIPLKLLNCTFSVIEAKINKCSFRYRFTYTSFFFLERLL